MNVVENLKYNEVVVGCEQSTYIYCKARKDEPWNLYNLCTCVLTTEGPIAGFEYAIILIN